MKTTLIPIGNSRGVRIPKLLIEECGLTGDIEMDVRGRTLILRAPTGARVGWPKAFAQMARLKDDQLADQPAATTLWEREEWEWK